MYKRFPKGTWMKLKSAELFRAFVGTESHCKISARRLALLVQCHPSFIDHLRAGRRKSCEPLTAQRIAEALEVPVEVLFDVKMPRETSQAKLGNNRKQVMA